MNPGPAAKVKGKGKPKVTRAAQKVKDADVRAQLDGGNLAGLRQALGSADQVRVPLVPHDTHTGFERS